MQTETDVCVHVTPISSKVKWQRELECHGRWCLLMHLKERNREWVISVWWVICHRMSFSSYFSSSGSGNVNCWEPQGVSSVSSSNLSLISMSSSLRSRTLNCGSRMLIIASKTCNEKLNKQSKIKSRHMYVFISERTKQHTYMCETNYWPCIQSKTRYFIISFMFGMSILMKSG